MQHHFPTVLENIPDVTLRWEKLFFCKTFQVIAEEVLFNHLQLEQSVFYITINYLRSLAFTVVVLNLFSCTPNQDRYRWNEMIQWVHETIHTAMSEVAIC
jgi:hypothetical protein